MPLNTVNFVNKGHLTHDDVGQYASLLTGVMTDQAVTIANDVTVRNLTITGNSINQTSPITNFIINAAMNDLILQSSGGDVRLATNGLTRWRVQQAGHLIAEADNTYDVGASGASRPRTVYAGTSVVAGSGTSLVTIGAIGQQYIVGGSFGTITFGTGGTGKWNIDSTGAIFGWTDNTYDIGKVGGGRPRTVYAATSFIGPGAVPVGGTTNQVLAKSSATDYAYAWVTPAAGLTLPLSQNLTFSPDNTYDVGASGASRPRDVNIGRNLILAGGIAAGGVSITSNIFANIAPTAAYFTSSTATGEQLYTTISSSVTFSGIGLDVKMLTQAATYTAASVYGIRVTVPSIGSNSTVTNLYGLYVDNQGKNGVTNAYGVYIVAQSLGSTTNISLYNQGTAQLVGNVGIGVAPVSYSGLIFQPTMAGANQFALYAPLTFSTTATGNTFVFYTLPTYAASTRTVSSGASFYADSPSLGAGVTVTQMNGLFVANQGASGVTNAYGIYINPQSGASSQNIAIQTNGPANVFGGRTNFGGTNAGDQHYFILFATTPPPTTGLGGMPFSDQTGLRIEYWANSLCSGSVTGMFAAVLGGAGGVQTTFANGIQIGNPGDQGGGIGTSAGLRIDAVVSGKTNNYELWLGVPSGATGDNKSLVFGSSGEYIRNPKNNVNSLSIESSDGYVMVSSSASSFMSGNAYWDGTNWNRFNVGGPATYISTGGAFPLTVAGAPAGANPIAWTNLATIDASGNATHSGKVYAAGFATGPSMSGGWPIAGDLNVSRGGSPVTGYVFLGDSAHYVGFDGTGYAFYGAAPLNVGGTISSAAGSIYLGPGGATANIVYGGAGNLVIQNSLTVSSQLYITDANHYLMIVGAAIRYAVPSGGVHSFEYTNQSLGPCQASAFTPGSARRIKTDIRLLADPLDILLDDRVHGVRYTEKATGFARVGFVADDWVPVEPSVVSFDDDGEVMALDYDRISAVTFEALKQYAIATNKRLAALEERMAA